MGYHLKQCTSFLGQNKTNGKQFFQFEVRIVAQQIGFDELQQKLTINISFNLKIYNGSLKNRVWWIMTKISVPHDAKCTVKG